MNNQHDFPNGAAATTDAVVSGSVEVSCQGCGKPNTVCQHFLCIGLRITFERPAFGRVSERLNTFGRMPERLNDPVGCLLLNKLLVTA